MPTIIPIILISLSLLLHLGSALPGIFPKLHHLSSPSPAPTSTPSSPSSYAKNSPFHYRPFLRDSLIRRIRCVPCASSPSDNNININDNHDPFTSSSPDYFDREDPRRFIPSSPTTKRRNPKHHKQHRHPLHYHKISNSIHRLASTCCKSHINAPSSPSVVDTQDFDLSPEDWMTAMSPYSSLDSEEPKFNLHLFELGIILQDPMIRSLLDKGVDLTRWIPITPPPNCTSLTLLEYEKAILKEIVEHIGEPTSIRDLHLTNWFDEQIPHLSREADAYLVKQQKRWYETLMKDTHIDEPSPVVAWEYAKYYELTYTYSESGSSGDNSNSASVSGDELNSSESESVVDTDTDSDSDSASSSFLSNNSSLPIPIMDYHNMNTDVGLVYHYTQAHNATIRLDPKLEHALRKSPMYRGPVWRASNLDIKTILKLVRGGIYGVEDLVKHRCAVVSGCTLTDKTVLLPGKLLASSRKDFVKSHPVSRQSPFGLMFRSKTGRWIAPLSKYKYEEEVVFLSGSKFKLLGAKQAENGFVMIYFEEI